MADQASAEPPQAPQTSPDDPLALYRPNDDMKYWFETISESRFDRCPSEWGSVVSRTMADYYNVLIANGDSKPEDNGEFINYLLRASTFLVSKGLM